MTQQDWEARTRELGIEIPEPIPGIGLYSPVVVHDRTAYTSGVVALQGPPWQLVYPGRLGDDLSAEDAAEAAAGAMISTLANLRGALGDLNRIDRFLKITGFLQVTPDFNRMTAVMDGASGVLGRIFGDDLLPARSAIGVASLPGGASVEIESVVALRP